MRLALCALAAVASSQTGGAGPASDNPIHFSDSTARGPTDPAELEAFLDGLVGAAMADRRVAGGVIAVVRHGQVLLSKGYGWSDVAARTPVDPDRTLFRIGSVTKTFTWTAVMQLVEQGKLDLDRDVNAYLDFTIPATFAAPVTLRHLMTHTAGFEDDNRDQEATDPADNVPLSEWLPSHRPARVREPGRFSSYSNWGAALAGYIVERVSGSRYEDYLERNVFGPLGMRWTTARQPLPDGMRDAMSEGYGWESGVFVAKPWEIIKGAGPAGAISSTAADMARWMLAHLAPDTSGPRILAPATLALMHGRAFVHDPRVNGWSLGFYEKSSHGVRVIGHGGGSRWFHTELALMPEEGLGLFASFNTDTGSHIAFGRLLDDFLAHYYPSRPTPRVDHGGLDRFIGSYLFNRQSYTTFQTAFGLIAAMPVRALDDTALEVALPFGAMQVVPIDSLLFQDRSGSTRIAFRLGEAGRATHAFYDLTPMMALERQPWHGAPRLHLAILAGALLSFGGVLIGALDRWRRRGRGAAEPIPLRRGRRLVAGMATANLAFAIALVAAFSNEATLLSASPRLLQVALALPLIGLALAVAAGAATWQVWRQRAGTPGERWRLAAMVLIALLFAWSLGYWNLLGWRM
ncbi:MAG: serine hydrolase domain-containing protein [Gemmatimonadales bacterium]